MSDAARLAKMAVESKPEGLAISEFVVSQQTLQNICQCIPEAIIDSSYAAAVSYSEAISGMMKKSSTWSVVRLYYSAFYSIKSLLLSEGVINFNCSGEKLLNIASGRCSNGGRSSHLFNWNALQAMVQGNAWFVSEDSKLAYEKLRKYPELANYNFAFPDPELHQCLISGDHKLQKRVRAYRDDDNYFYTYLDGHLAISYPTKLIFSLDSIMADRNLQLDEMRRAHLKSIWQLDDRCPMT